MTQLRTRGILFDVGSDYELTRLTREVWNPASIERDIRVIATDLRCNAVLLFGTPPDRLATAGRLALLHGLEVWIQPRRIDGTVEEVGKHLAEVAGVAQALHASAPGRVVLDIGCELSLFMAGVLQGDSFSDRIDLLRKLGMPTEANEVLNRALGALAAMARHRFKGKLTYSAGSWEGVDWSPFDIVSLDVYLTRGGEARYEATLKRAMAFGKPFVVTEFGCCCFQGADDLGAGGSFKIVSDNPPRMEEGMVRDERVQAENLQTTMRVLQACGVTGAFIYGFSEPGNLRTADPRTDLDMAGFGIVSVLEPATATRMEVWHPKAGFQMVQELYGVMATSG